MRIWNEYVTYLKDNPEGYWFKRKLYGYGWTPAKPAGWAVVAAYLLLVLGVVVYTEQNGGVEAHASTIIGIVVAATALLVAISWKTGEPPKWQWGPAHHDD